MPREIAKPGAFPTNTPGLIGAGEGRLSVSRQQPAHPDRVILIIGILHPMQMEKRDPVGIAPSAPVGLPR